MNKDFYKGENFWNKDPKNKRHEYPINDEIIKKAENILDVHFPSSFIELMKKQNGGELNYPYFTEYKESLPSIEPIHFRKDDLGILSSKELLAESDLPKELIVLWTNCHEWIVLDYRKGNENPSVVYIVENYFTEEIEWEFHKIADTFDDLLNQLFRISPKKAKNRKGFFKRKRR
ncbi:SMI1/KNR4 family protein [Rummeliibacillus pycnus]|uniref:SMI1/KNR4 family protein n=1 Tax=Rummeliibacillus pycnus TaxID=101070 RepID=UPI003D2C8276